MGIKMKSLGTMNYLNNDIDEEKINVFMFTK